ncbi:hypothetical protein MRX96_010958 [Rhipicephalus microplus]
MCRRVFICFLVCGVVAAVLIGFFNQGPDPFKVNKTGYWGDRQRKEWSKTACIKPDNIVVMFKSTYHGLDFTYELSLSSGIKFLDITISQVRAAPEDNPVIFKFSVHAPEEALLDLKRRLASSKLAEPLQESRFEYGFNAHELRRVVDHWKDRFDWRQQERLLNAYEHYHTTIEGIRVHFMYARPKAHAKTKVYTLLMIHGWPGSVVEFLKIAKELATPKQGVAFEVICPSIPRIRILRSAAQERFQ